MTERKKPTFLRRQSTMITRLKHRSSLKWLRPRGRDNKMRLKFKGVARKAEIGWGNKKSEKGKHNGEQVIVISNPSQMDNLKKNQAILLSGFGKKKKLELKEKAEKLGLIIKNKYFKRESNATS